MPLMLHAANCRKKIQRRYMSCHQATLLTCSSKTSSHAEITYTDTGFVVAHQMLPFAVVCLADHRLRGAMGELDATYGAVLIGAFVSAVLFGVTNLQAFIYFQRYSSDGVWSKIAVCWLWLLDAVHLAFVAHMVYWYLVTNYFNPLELTVIVWTFKAQIIVDAIVVISVHSLYTVRIWKLSMADSHPSAFLKFLRIAVTVIVILGYGAVITLCYEIVRFHEYTDLLAARWVTYFPLGVATCIDAIIAFALCYLLRRCRTGHSKMDSTISVLMLFTVNTGIVTSLCSLTAMAMMAALPNTFAVLSVEFMVTKLYVNSFMAMFNARNSLRSNGFTSERSADLHLRPISGSWPSTQSGQKWVASPTTDLRTEIAYTGMAY